MCLRPPLWNGDYSCVECYFSFCWSNVSTVYTFAVLIEYSFNHCANKCQSKMQSFGLVDCWIISSRLNPSFGIQGGLVRAARGWLKNLNILKPSFSEKIKRLPRSICCVLNEAWTFNLTAALSYFLKKKKTMQHWVAYWVRPLGAEHAGGKWAVSTSVRLFLI